MKHSKVVIITGGGKGIGAECARYLHAQGMSIVIAELDPKLEKDFALDADKFLFLKTDVKEEASVKALVQKTVKKFGRIDAVINNAGLLPNNLPSIEKMSLKIWNDFIETNLTSAFLSSKHAVPYLRKSKGSIINIASTRFLQSEGDDLPYSATKGGLVSLTHALAVQLGPEIRVNCISPGWINSHHEKFTKTNHQQHPVGRVGEPRDIAAMAAYLISDKAGFITGQNFIIDGGMTVKMIYK
ncbi:MAG: SDR family oxidoreductase [Parachlamydiales bacterium]|jgi:hypothetical protein